MSMPTINKLANARLEYLNAIHSKKNGKAFLETIETEIALMDTSERIMLAGLLMELEYLEKDVETLRQYDRLKSGASYDLYRAATLDYNLH